MKTPIDPHAPAFLSAEKTIVDPYFVKDDGSQVMKTVTTRGLTIRAEFASRIMAGMLADPERQGCAREFAGWAVECADALIHELNREEKP